MITFKLNGKPVDIATSWDELNYSQFYETFNLDSDFLKTVSIVSGLDYELIKGGDIQGNIEGLIQAMNFLKKPAKWDQPVLQCGPYKLPINHKGQYNIQYESLGQFEDMRMLLQSIAGKGPKELTAIYPDMVAIYLQKVRDGEYNPQKAKDMVSEIRTYLAREVVTLGSFFTIKLSSLLTGTPDNSPTTPQNQKRSKPVSKDSSRRSGRSPRSRKSR